MDTPAVDVVIVGAGIAGAALAWQLVQPGPAQRSVLLLERESQPGAHATGRSAAMFMQSYGSPQGRALTRASRAFYAEPPEGFAATPLLGERGALYVALPGQQALLAALQAELAAAGGGVERLGADDALALVPVLRRERVHGALFEADARDIDVHALHQGYLRGARRAGATLWLDAELARATHGARGWQVALVDGRMLHARTLVDAAGAWADEVARRCGLRPLGLQPRRRSAFTFDAPAGTDCARWPVVAGIDEAEGWYFKPDAQRLLGSPANADVVPAHDVLPEAIDIATAIARIEHVSTLTIRRPASTWAGLRSFAPDDELLIGFDARVPSFFWLAGQGGWGIQSAQGAAQLAAALLAHAPLPAGLAAHGVSADAVAPARLAC
jgi:D-arginine dehydrogenase